MSNFNHSNIKHNAITNYELKANREKNKPKILNPELTKGFHINNLPNKEYKDYLDSYKWKKIRKKAIKTYESCVLCGSENDMEVHHRTYANFKNESITRDLIVLCSRCHAKYHYWKSGIKHQNRKRKNKTKKPIFVRG